MYDNFYFVSLTFVGKCIHSAFRDQTRRKGVFLLAERRILLGRKYVHGLSNNSVKVEKNKEEKEGLKETKGTKIRKQPFGLRWKLSMGQQQQQRLRYFPRLVIEQRKASTTINDHTLPADSVKADRSLEKKKKKKTIKWYDYCHGRNQVSRNDIGRDSFHFQRENLSGSLR